MSENDVLAAAEKVGNSFATVQKELTNAKLLKSNDLPLNAESKEIRSRTAISSRKLWSYPDASDRLQDAPICPA